MEPTARNSTPYSPKTEQERNEAFRLLDEFEKELARHVAFREAVVESLAGSAASRRATCWADLAAPLLFLFWPQLVAPEHKLLEGCGLRLLGCSQLLFEIERPRRVGSKRLLGVFHHSL